MATRPSRNKSGESGEGRRGSAGSMLSAMTGALRGGLNRMADMVSSDDDLDALDLLKAQHRYVEKLFAKIGDGDGDGDGDARGPAKAAAFRELADLLAVHATIEEKIFYPSVKSPKTEALLLEAAEEHLAMKRVLADLLALDVDSPTFDSKLTVLEEEVSHHAKEEEEGKLFPLVRAERDADFRAGIAGEMIALMVELDQQGAPRASVPGETDKAAPI